MSLTYDCRDCGEQEHVSFGGHDTCSECVAKMRARKDEIVHIHEKVLRYVLFVLRGSETVTTDLCDEVQMAADETKAEIERLQDKQDEANVCIAHNDKLLGRIEVMETLIEAMGATIDALRGLQTDQDKIKQAMRRIEAHHDANPRCPLCGDIGWTEEQDGPEDCQCVLSAADRVPL